MGFFSTQLLKADTPVTPGPDDMWAAAVGEFTAAGKSDLFLVKRRSTGTNMTELHILSADSGYTAWVHQNRTALHVTDDTWEFGLGRWNSPGPRPDLFAIKKRATGSNSTEVHIMSVASGWLNFVTQTGTSLPETDSRWTFAIGDFNNDGTPDLWAINRGGAQRTELVILSGAPDGAGRRFQTRLFSGPIALPPTNENWTFQLGDWNGDGRLDLFAVNRLNTPSLFTEVTILDGANSFGAVLLETETSLPDLGRSCQFAVADYDGSGQKDLIAVDMVSPITVRIVSGANDGTSTANLQPVDLVVLIDTSGSMQDEAADLSREASAAVERARTQCRTRLRTVWLGIEGTWAGTRFDRTARNYLAGIGVAGSNFVATPGDLEDGAATIVDLARHFDWRADAERLVLYLGDEGLEAGDPHDSSDVTAANQAITVATAQNVRVLTYFGTPLSGPNPVVLAEYQRVAVSTGGSFFSAPASALGGFDAILRRILCQAAMGLEIHASQRSIAYGTQSGLPAGGALMLGDELTVWATGTPGPLGVGAWTAVNVATGASLSGPQRADWTLVPTDVGEHRFTFAGTFAGDAFSISRLIPVAALDLAVRARAPGASTFTPVLWFDRHPDGTELAFELVVRQNAASLPMPADPATPIRWRAVDVNTGTQAAAQTGTLAALREWRVTLPLGNFDVTCEVDLRGNPVPARRTARQMIISGATVSLTSRCRSPQNVTTQLTDRQTIYTSDVVDLECVVVPPRPNLRYQWSAVETDASGVPTGVFAQGPAAAAWPNFSRLTEGYVAFLCIVEDQAGNQIGFAERRHNYVQPIGARDAQWRIQRIGTYSGRLGPHASRPYLAERTPDDRRAGEILIEPLPDPLGMVPNSGIFGRTFDGTLAAPESVELSPGLIVRAFFEAFQPGLPATAWQDFSGTAHVTRAAARPWELVINLSATRDIHAIQLLDVRVSRADRMPGQALALRFEYSPPVAPTTVTPAPPAPAPVVLGPLINLLLYTRDLGAAMATGVHQQLSNAGDCHCLVNGNLYLEVPITKMEGHGISLDLSLCYNSLAASRQDAVDLLVQLNGVTAQDAARQYGGFAFAKGWTHTYEMSLREYFRPADAPGQLIEEYLELSCPDGNRLQFVRRGAADPNTATIGDFVPVHPSDHWLGSAEIGHSLCVMRSAPAIPGGAPSYTLSDLQGNVWTFDDALRLASISTSLTRHSTALQPLTIQYLASETVVRDTRGRELRIAKPIGGSLPAPAMIRPSVGDQTIVTVENTLIREIFVASRQSWKFDYTPHLAQPAGGATPATPCGFIQTFTDPRGIPTTYEYYDGRLFHGVSADISAACWGRLGRSVKGGPTDRREHLWRHQAFSPGTSSRTAVHRDRSGVEWEISWRTDLQAVSSIGYVVQTRDPATLELTGQAATPRQVRTVKTATYAHGTKLLEDVSDERGHVTHHEYVAVANNRAYLLRLTREPDGIEQELAYNAQHRLWKRFNPRRGGSPGTGPFTEYRYETNRGQLTEVVHVDLGANDGGVITETWTYDPATGRVQTNRDVDGVMSTFGYDDPTRDPGGTGLSTSRAVELRRAYATARTLTWLSWYDARGRLRGSYEPTCGAKTTFDYHELGPLAKTTQQPIQTDSGALAAAEIDRLYDELLAPRLVTIAGGEEWTYDDHGGSRTYTDRAGLVWTYVRTGEDVLRSLQHPDGHVTTYVYDEMRRLVRTNYPVPDTRTGAQASETFTDVVEYDDAAGMLREKRYVVSSVGAQPSATNLRRTIETRIVLGRTKQVDTSHGPGTPVRREIVAEFDIWGKPKVTTLGEGTSVRRTFTVSRDSWGREVATEEASGSSRRTTGTRRTPRGLLREELPPTFTTDPPGGRPKATYSHDELGRLHEIRNSAGTVVARYEYDDYGEDVASPTPRVTRHLVYAQNPAAAPGVDELIVVRETDYNRRGLEIQTWEGPDHTTAAITTTSYDQFGRTVGITDSNGMVQRIIPDTLDRPASIEVMFPARRAGVPWATFDKSTSAHVETARYFVTHDYSPEGVLKSTSGPAGSETRTYDRLGRAIVTTRSDGSREEVSYDALDRVKRRSMPGGVDVQFAYNDAARTVETTTNVSSTFVTARYTYDLEGLLKEYRCVRNQIPGLGAWNEGFHIAYGYSDFGKLHTKEYKDSAGTLVGSITTVYNAADLRTQTSVQVRVPGGALVSEQFDHAYNADMRLVKFNSGQAAVCRFVYNHAGLLRKLTRTQNGIPADQDTNSTSFEHDRMSRLLRMTERSGRDSDDRRLSELDLHYSTRTVESWERAGAWNVGTKDLLPTNSPLPRGITLRRRYAEGTGNPLDKFAQDLAYSGEGEVIASQTSRLTGTVVRVDNRWKEMTAGNTVTTTERTYRRYPTGTGAFTDVVVRKREETPVGMPGRIDDRLTLRATLMPRVEPAGFHEALEYGTDRHLSTTFAVQENLTATGTDLEAAAVQEHRRFVHDGLGRLVTMWDRSEIRGTTLVVPDLEADTAVPGANHSFEHLTTFVYGPDGEPVLRSTTGQGVPGTIDAVIISDGSSPLMEADSSGRVQSRAVVPGVALHLWLNQRNTAAGAWTRSWYRWDHRGATLFTTNADGGVVTDFLFTTPEGERDLFGESIGPGPVGAPETDQRRLVDLWAQYQPSGPRADMLMNSVSKMDGLTERRTAQLDATALGAGRNQYGFQTGYPHTFTAGSPPAYSTTETVIQSVIDFNRAFWDAITLGITKGIREFFWGARGEPQLAGPYIAGSLVGLAVAVYLGYGAAFWTGTAGTLARIYTFGGAIIAFLESSIALASGKFKPIHTLGFLPALGVLVSAPRYFFALSHRFLAALYQFRGVSPMGLPLHELRNTIRQVLQVPGVAKQQAILEVLEDVLAQHKLTAGVMFDLAGDIMPACSRMRRVAFGLPDWTTSSFWREGIAFEAARKAGVTNPDQMMKLLIRALDHAEGQAIAYMMIHGLKEMRVVINHPAMCQACQQLRFVLPRGSTLQVFERGKSTPRVIEGLFVAG